MRSEPAPQFAPMRRDMLSRRVDVKVPHVETLDLQLVTLEPKETLITPGQAHPYLYFVLDGLMRVAVITPDGVERVTNIFEPGQMLGVPMLYRSRWLGASGVRNNYVERVLDHHREGDPPYLVTALNQCTMLRITYAEVEALATQHQEWATVVLHHLAVYAAMGESRVVEFLTLSPEERYESFLRTRGHLLDVVSKRDIAWLLGVTPESLSRIRARHRDRATSNSQTA